MCLKLTLHLVPRTGLAMSSSHYIDPYSPSEMTPADVTIKCPPTPMNTMVTGQFVSDYSVATAKFLTDKDLDDVNSLIR